MIMYTVHSALVQQEAICAVCYPASLLCVPEDNALKSSTSAPELIDMRLGTQEFSNILVLHHCQEI